MGSERRAHVARVVRLLDRWAAALGLGEGDRTRWRAAGWLHDALRDAPAASLRPLLPADLAALPAPLLHGPAAAERLREEGVADAPLLDAIRYHTVGHPSLDRLGRALYLADYLEPGRTFAPLRNAVLRARLPEAFDAVLREVVAERLGHQLETGRPLRPESVAFWNALAGHS